VVLIVRILDGLCNIINCDGCNSSGGRCDGCRMNGFSSSNGSYWNSCWIKLYWDFP
jgi:hypothetical protein